MSAGRTEYKQTFASNEQGFVLIVTMLVLVVLTVLCIGALDNSTFEVQIAANDRNSRVAFNLADGGVFATGDLLEETYLAVADPNYPAVLMLTGFPDPDDGDYAPELPVGAAGVDTVANAPGIFYSRISGMTGPRADGKYDFMLRTPNGLGDVFGRMIGQSIEATPGENTEYAQSALKPGATGGTSLLIDFTIDSYSANNSRSSLGMRYRKLN